jgi:hypothetical protein
MRYVTLLGVLEMTHAVTALGGHASVIGVSSFAELMKKLENAPFDRIVLDPSLLTAADANTIVAYSKKHLVSMVAYTSFSPTALEACVILARNTSAQFVHRGSINERFTLKRALFLAPDAQLGQALLARLSKQMDLLPCEIRNTIAAMLQTGAGPSTPTDLAAQSGVARRSLDRWLTLAGFTSARLLIGAPTIVAGYQAITSSTIPLARVAGMLGCATQRCIDARFHALLGVTSSQLRHFPFEIPVAASMMAQRLAGVDNGIAAEGEADARYEHVDPISSWFDDVAGNRPTGSSGRASAGISIYQDQ